MGEPVGEPVGEPEGEPVASAAPATGVTTPRWIAASAVRLGARLAWRAALGQWITGAVFALLIGVVSVGVRRVEGAEEAILFVGVLVPVILIDAVRRARAVTRGQHRYLLLQRPPAPPALWRGLVLGHGLVAGAAGALYYLLAVALHLRAGRPADILLFVMPSAEMGLWIMAAAHLTDDGASRASSTVLFGALSAAVFVALVAKMILTYPVSFALGAATSAMSMALAVAVAGRAPLRAGTAARRSPAAP